MKSDRINTEKQAGGSKTIWVFTPSRTAPADLEFILVQRQKLLQDAVERVRESALTGHKHHLLFVGPRGCGKTHLVTLVVSRLRADAKLADRLRIAWLNEDETCTTLLELLLKIHAALARYYPAEYNEEMLNEAYELNPDAALEFISRHLLTTLSSRTLLVVVENLDAIFAGLGDAGQKNLRAFIQEHPQFTIVATAQQLVEDLSSRTSPFFGFFQTEHLKSLNVEEAAKLLQNIARLQEKTGVVEFLATSRGHSRVRALHHLSGGNHRIYIVLSQFITRDSIESLLEPFMKMVDELTPYYQERIRWLPALQRKIVEFLCGCEGTVAVREIAKKLFSTPQTISSQLQLLREKGYVEASQRGRESLYEITETLMRICVEVKDNQQHQPLRLLVDFLRVWYDDKELKNHLGKLDPFSASCAYIESALQKNNTEGNLRKQIIFKDLQLSLSEKMTSSKRNELLRELANQPEAIALALMNLQEGKEPEARTCLAEAIAEESTSNGKAELFLFRAQLYSSSGDRQHELEDLSAVVGLTGAPVEQVARALVNRGITYDQACETQLAIVDYAAVIGLSGAPVELVAEALVYRGITYGKMGEAQLEIADYTTVIGLSGAPVEQVAKALFNRGITHWQLGETQLAIADYTAVIGLSGAPVDQVARTLVNRGTTYGQMGETQLEIADYTVVIGLPGAPVESVARALLNRGITYGQMGEAQLEIADYTAVISLPGAPIERVAKALVNRGSTYWQTGAKPLAITDFTALIGLPGAPVSIVARALVNRGIAYGQEGDKPLAIADYTAVIGLPDAPVELVAEALLNRAFAHGQAGKPELAIADSTAVTALPGVPAELIARALGNRGFIREQIGGSQLAIADYTAVIGLSGIPVMLVSLALYSRGLIYFRANRKQEAQSDFESICLLQDAPVNGIVDSYLALSVIHFSEGKWTEGFQTLETGLNRGASAQPPYQRTATDLVSVVFSAGLSFEGRLDKVNNLLSIYNKHKALPVLGEKVVQHTGQVFRTGEPFPSADNLEGWALAWEQAAESVPEFRLSIRLLRTGVNFIKAGGKDPGILLDLTSTERSILEQALGLAEKEPAKSG